MKHDADIITVCVRKIVISGTVKHTYAFLLTVFIALCAREMEDYMAYCTTCGTQVPENSRFCPSCGHATASSQTASPNEGTQASYDNTSYNNNQVNYSNATPQSDVDSNKGLAILSYLGILVLIPIIAAPKSRFARYHSNQGLVLMIAEAVYAIAATILTVLLLLAGWVGVILVVVVWLLSIAFLVFAIMGLVNAAKGEMKPLPIIGGIVLIKSDI